jgi:zinc/manganese transport system ATP-binding protein
MSAVELSDETLALGGRVVLDRISFAIPEGAFVGILGPRDSGKPTLMRGVLGVDAA